MYRSCVRDVQELCSHQSPDGVLHCNLLQSYVKKCEESTEAEAVVETEVVSNLQMNVYSVSTAVPINLETSSVAAAVLTELQTYVFEVLN